MSNGWNDLTGPGGQKTITKWSITAGSGISLITYLLGKTDVAVGIMFACILMVFNYWALSFVPRIFDKFKLLPTCGKVAAFTYYHMRFWLIVLALFLTVPKAGVNFALGCLVGFIIPKIAMGAIVIANTGEDWWSERKAPAETNLGPENRKLTALERELMNSNPFEFDIIDFEWKNYLKNR